MQNKTMAKFLALISIVPMSIFVLASEAIPQDSNRLTYLDEFCDPYYPNVEFPKLISPQWIGEEGVDAVITFGIDDMRDPEKYEAYLRPILDRLKKIDGRAPVSIMTCSVDSKHPQLQTWLAEGLSIECHTIDHPCPCLQAGNFKRAKSTYDRCVDLVGSIKNNTPVAFRFPCMDSLNTPSPRAFAEIINQTTANGKFLQASTSVTCLFTPDDPELRETIFKDDLNRFKKYIPFPSFVNRIDNYPYPYVIAGKCWEFPCTIPDDWQGQNIQRPNNPATVHDLKAAIDATVIKKGIANIVFHPHGWIKAEQIVEVISYVEKKYGKRVKFLTFRECMDRINKNLLLNEPIRDPKNGTDNGVRLADVNEDGFMDVVIGNKKTKVTRIWNVGLNRFQDSQHNIQVAKTRFGSAISKQKTEGKARQTTFCIAPKDDQFVLKSFNVSKSTWDELQWKIDLGKDVSINSIRLRDVNNDGQFEIIVGEPSNRKIVHIDLENGESNSKNFPVSVVDKNGRDNGVRFIDFDKNNFADILISNDRTSAIYLFFPEQHAFKKVETETLIPQIVTGGTNNGVWFANDHLWIQNENTNRLPDGVDRRHFHQLLAKSDPPPRSPSDSQKSIEIDDAFEIELMAAEPLVMDPIAIEWGIDGKLWVVEMADYPLGLDDKGEPGGRIRYLEDTNGDGAYDKSTLFVDEIPFPTGVLPINTDPNKPACLITAAPYLVRAEKPGNWIDLISTPNAVLLEGFTEGNQQHRFNGFSLGLDNWIYVANGDSGGTIASPGFKQRININGRDLRFKFGNEFQFEAQTGQTQFGRHRDDWGNWFGCSNPIPIRHYILPEHYMKRNPHFKYPSPRNDIARTDNTQLFPISRVLSHWSGYIPPKAGGFHRFTSACSTNFYRDDLFGKDFSDNTFTCEPVHNLVQRRKLIPDGVTYQSRRVTGEETSEFLASTDSWFRPTSITTGPDGALWVTDMYRLVIEHPEWIDDQRETELFLRAGHDKGRIYRIFPKQIKPRRLPTKESLAEGGLKQFVKRIESPNRWDREFAQLVAVNNPNLDVSDYLRTIAIQSANPLERIHAACSIEGRGELDAQLLLDILDDSNGQVQRNAIRISESFLKRSDSAIVARVSKLAESDDIRMKMQTAFSLGFSKSDIAASTLARLLKTNFENQYLVAAVMSSVSNENIAAALSHVRDKTGLNDAELLLCEQAVRMGQTHLVSSTLEKIYASKNVDGMSTRQLESIVAIYETIISTGTKLQRDKLDQKAFGFANRMLDDNNEQQSARRRNAAIGLLIRSPFSSQEDRKLRLLGFVSPQYGLAIQKKCVAALSKISDVDIAMRLIIKWRSLSPELRADVIQTIASRADWSNLLFESFEKKKLKPMDLSAAQIRAFTSHSNADIAKRAKRLFSQSAESDRSQLIEDYSISIARLKPKPDIKQGQKLFEKSCSSCHRIENMGTAIGPDITAIKERSYDAFLTAIIDPAKAVEDKYRSYIVALNDGRELVGMIESESANQISLATTDGKRVVVLRTEIERIKSTGKSLMPEGLENEISPTQMHHLLEYLLASKSQTPLAKPKRFPGNAPKTIEAKPDSKTELAATSCEIRGPSLVFESKYQNLGFWNSRTDTATWLLKNEVPREFTIWLNYASADQNADNSFQIAFLGDGNFEKSLTGKVATTGSWDKYQRMKVGTVKLSTGKFRVVVQPLKIDGFLMDLRSIELIPK